MNLGQVVSLSDTGRKRRHNEDSFVCDPPLFAIADGMGGAQAGEVASELAASALQGRGDEPGTGEARVVELIREANRRVFERAHEDASYAGMGTTLTLALVEDGKVSLGHVGDSRAYLLRAGQLEQITEDVRGCAKIGTDEVFFDPAFAPGGQSLDHWLSLLEQMQGMMSVN